jgi:hypothetical protein
MSTSTPSTIATLSSNADVLREASRMTNIERFFHLWQQAKVLVEHHGPYTTHENTTVFTRASDLRRPTKDSAEERLAYSLAAAQDCVNSAQPDSPAKDDLLLFTRLWEIAITILENILARGSLPQETFGWGIFGLAAGYMHPASFNYEADIRSFANHKYRLQYSLLKLPSMTGKRRSEYVVSERTSTSALVKVRRECHTCGHILLDEFRKGSWRRVRWFHVVEVCERWIRAFELVPQKEEEPDQAREDMQQEVQDEAKEQDPLPAPEEVQGEAPDQKTS